MIHLAMSRFRMSKNGCNSFGESCRLVRKYTRTRIQEEWHYGCAELLSLPSKKVTALMYNDQAGV